VSAGPEKVIRDEIRELSAYHVQPAQGMVKLDAMENPYRLPEPLRSEIGELAANAEINRYPDPTAPALMRRLREVMGIGPEYDVLLGNGSDEIIHIIMAVRGASRGRSARASARLLHVQPICAVRGIALLRRAPQPRLYPRYRRVLARHCRTPACGRVHRLPQ